MKNPIQRLRNTIAAWRLRKKLKEAEVVFATQDEVEFVRGEIDRIVEAMGHDPGGCFISDESSIGDFLLDADELARLEIELAVKVEEKDLLIEVARRMRGLA